MKKYALSDSRLWNSERVLINCGLSSKVLPLASESRMQDGRDVLMG